MSEYKSCTDLFGGKLITKDRVMNTDDVLASKKFVLLRPPCRSFTPVLAEIYSKQGASECEIVFVSSDGDEDAFQEYYAEMPWCALPFSEKGKNSDLSSQCNVSGIPKLVVFKIQGNKAKMVDGNGRDHVVNKGNLGFDCLT